MASRAPARHQWSADLGPPRLDDPGRGGHAFVHNSDFRQASSLAFYSTLTLLPTLLLLTFLLSLGIGSSRRPCRQTSHLIHQVCPGSARWSCRRCRPWPTTPAPPGP